MMMMMMMVMIVDDGDDDDVCQVMKVILVKEVMFAVNLIWQP